MSWLETVSYLALLNAKLVVTNVVLRTAVLVSNDPIVCVLWKFKAAFDFQWQCYWNFKWGRFVIVRISLKEAPYRVRGSVLSNVARLDDEYFKILQSANGHEMEYDER